MYQQQAGYLLLAALSLCFILSPALRAQELVWAKRAGATSEDEGNGIAVDGAGNSYVTGAFEGSAIFGAGETNEITLTGTSFEIFVAKYDASGDLVWAKRAGGTSADFGVRIALDGAGNSYVTGGFGGSATFGLDETNQTTLVGAGGNEIFVAKYDASGDLVWAKRAGGTSGDFGIGIAVDGAGNSYVTGFFEVSATFGAGETNETILTSAGNRDIFVAKYDASGDLVWAKRAGGTIADFASGIAVNGSGNSYVSGQFAGSATFGVGETSETTLTTAGGRDIFVAKYDASGDLVWAKRAGGTGADSASGIAVDGADNSYVTGDFAGSATFGAGETNETTLPSAGAPDIFVAKFGLGVPTLTSLSMPIALLGGAGFTLTLNGVDFVAGSVVEFDMVARATTFLDTMTLTVPVTMGDLATIQTFSVQVVNPGPGGTSLALPLAVENPAPTLALLDPPIASVGDAAFTLTVNGNNFVSSSVVEFNGGARATTFVDPFTLTVPVTMGDLATIQTFSVQVVNPGPGGGTSLPLPLAVENPAPTLTSLSMPIALLGGPAFTLTLSGVDFVSSSVVQFDGVPRATTFLDTMTLTVPVTMPDLATIQTFLVRVVTSGPGGGPSGALPLAVENPAPTLTSLSMPVALFGGAGFTLTLNGADFVPGSVVEFDGVPRVTTFLDTMTLTVPVTMPDLATIQTFSVRVVTPGPGGGTSGALPLAVENPAPTLTSLSMPIALLGGAAFTLTVNGAGFVPGSVVEFDGVPRATTFVDPDDVDRACHDARSGDDSDLLGERGDVGAGRRHIGGVAAGSGKSGADADVTEHAHRVFRRRRLHA